MHLISYLIFLVNADKNLNRHWLSAKSFIIQTHDLGCYNKYIDIKGSVKEGYLQTKRLSLREYTHMEKKSSQKDGKMQHGSADNNKFRIYFT